MLKCIMNIIYIRLWWAGSRSNSLIVTLVTARDIFLVWSAVDIVSTRQQHRPR